MAEEALAAKVYSMPNLFGLSQSERAGSYREFAEELRQKAEAAAAPESRDAFLGLAASWETLADSIDPAPEQGRNVPMQEYRSAAALD